MMFDCTQQWRALACASLVCSVSMISAPYAAGQTTDAPVISPIADMDSTVYNGGARQTSKSLSITVSNSPSSVTATGMPPGVYFEQISPYYHFSWYEEFLQGGVHTVTVTASNASGSSSRSFRWVVHPSMMSYIHPDKLTYTVGDVVTLSTRYSVPVVVTGSPYIELWPGKNAVYSSGSGTTDLRFQTTITSADTTHTGILAVAIKAGNGAIATPDGASANLAGMISDRAGGRATPFDVVVPQSPQVGPAINLITSPPAGVYGPRQPVNLGLTVNFNARVTVTGSPSIVVRIGSVDREFRSGQVTASGTGVIFFYGFSMGDPMNDDGTLRITGPIKLNSGAIKGTDGTDASLVFTPVDAPSVVFDATPPTTPSISGVTPASPTPQQTVFV
jgi:hypothetical protein